MSDRISVGVLGLTHDHVWDNLPHLAQNAEAELAAAADPNAPLRDRVREEYGGRTYQDPEEMLDREALDAVYVYADNASGAEWARQALTRGLHVMIEKPLAAHLRGAETVVQAARESGRRVMVNWPFAWWPQLQTACEMASAGEIGTVWQVKYRAAHAGPEKTGCSSYFCDWLFDAERNGAGALMDYCCYGAALARALLGVPERVTGVAGRLCKTDLEVDDNAALMMQYPRALSISEASWTQIDKVTAYRPMIYGTGGTLVVEPRPGGRLWKATPEHPEGVEVDVPAPPPHRRDSAAHFVQVINSGDDLLPLCDLEACRDVQEMLEAGLRSAREGRAVALPVEG